MRIRQEFHEWPYIYIITDESFLPYIDISVYKAVISNFCGR